MDSVLTCLVNDTLGPGEKSSELAAAVAHYLGIGGGVSLRERSRAFSIALDHLDLRPGAKLAMDPLLPAVYHDVVVNHGLEPLYVDVAEHVPCIDAGLLEDLDEPPGAVVTHTSLGFVPDMERIERLGVPILEDISEGLGSNTGDRPAGSYGRFVIVAMEPDSIVTAGGGALLLASTKADAARLKSAVDQLPGDARLPDMNAALGLTQLKQIERFISRRAELAAAFTRAVMRGRHSVPSQPGDAQNVHFSFPVLLSGAVVDVRAYCRKKGVETELAHADTIFALTRNHDADTKPLERDAYPHSRAAALRCLRFPLYPALTGNEAESVQRVLSTLP